MGRVGCLLAALTLLLCHFITLSLAAAAAVGPVIITEGEAMLQDAPTLRGPRDEVSDGPRINILRDRKSVV